MKWPKFSELFKTRKMFIKKISLQRITIKFMGAEIRKLLLLQDKSLGVLARQRNTIKTLSESVAAYKGWCSKYRQDIQELKAEMYKIRNERG